MRFLSVGKVYKNCPRLLQILWKILKQIGAGLDQHLQYQEARDLRVDQAGIEVKIGQKWRAAEAVDTPVKATQWCAGGSSDTG